VEGLDRRREPGNELPDEDGGDGRMRDAAGGGWEDFEGSGRGAATRFEIHGGGLEEPKEEGGGEDGRGKKKAAGEGEPASGCRGRLGYGIAIPYPGYRI
jgi:hypothetical protein